MSTQPLLSIIIPAFNEENQLSETVLSVLHYCEEQKWQYEILIVDDGSIDTTASIAQVLESEHSCIRLLQHKMNKGKGEAVKTGVLASRGEKVLFMDADHSVDITHLRGFMYELENGSDIVIASIEVPGAFIDDVHGKVRRWAGTTAKLLIRLCATPGIHDTQRGFKLFAGEYARSIFAEVQTKGWGFDIEVLSRAQKLGLHICELPVAWHNRKRSKIGAYDYFRTLLELVNIMRLK